MRVSFPSFLTQIPLQYTVGGYEGAAVRDDRGGQVRVSHRRHIHDDHDVAFLVVFSSSTASSWLLQMQVSAYGEAAVCIPDSYSPDGLQRTLPPLLPLPISGVNITVQGDVVSFFDGQQLMLPTGDCRCAIVMVKNPWRVNHW